MTDFEIEQTIAAAQEVIRNRNRLHPRARYTPSLRSAIVTAANVMGVGQFSEETGVGTNLIYRWSGRAKQREIYSQKSKKLGTRAIRKNKTARANRSRSSAGVKGVRQIEVVSEALPPIFTGGNHGGMAVIRAGEQLAIQVPLSASSAEWIAQVAISLNSLNGRGHV